MIFFHIWCGGTAAENERGRASVIEASFALIGALRGKAIDKKKDRWSPPPGTTHLVLLHCCIPTVNPTVRKGRDPVGVSITCPIASHDIYMYLFSYHLGMYCSM